ncbi:MAG: CHAD domain-containing protein [Pseudomonadota bacterium]
MRIVKDQAEASILEFTDKEVKSATRVHSFRKRCKKIRGFLLLIRPAIGECFALANQPIKDAGRALSQARDFAIVEELTASMGTHHRESFGISEHLAEFCEKRVKYFIALMNTWPKSISPEQVAQGYEITYRRFRKAYEHAKERETIKTLHTVRKWAKYHWYQTRILEKIDRPVLRQHRELMREIGDCLGQAHDAAMALRQTGEGSKASKFRGQLERSMIEKIQKAKVCLVEATRQKPSYYATRIESALMVSQLQYRHNGARGKTIS